MYQSHRSRRAVKAAAMVALIVGAIACNGEDGTRSDRSPEDQKIDPATARTVTIRAEGSGPYQVYVRAAEVGKDLGDHTRETIAGGKYKQTLDYTSGLRIEITITATGHSDDIVSCEISDGTYNHAKERRAGQAQCKLTTAR